MHILLLAFQKFSFINPSMRISTAKIYYYLRLIRRAPKVQQKVQVGNAATRLRLCSPRSFLYKRVMLVPCSRAFALALALALTQSFSTESGEKIIEIAQRKVNR